MKKPWKILSLLSLVSFALISCGPSLQREPAETSNNNNLRAAYGRISGIYQGTVSPRSQREYPVEIKIYTVDQPMWNGSSAIVVSEPILRAYFRRLDVDQGTAYTMRAKYDPENGSIVLENSILSLVGRHNAGTITGESRIMPAEIGTFEVTRISTP